MIESRFQSDDFRQQHAIAEHVARHIAYADHAEGLGLCVLAHFAEMAFDGFPGAARGDAHFLVVIADRSAGGEGVAQPEFVVRRKSIRDV